MEEVEVSSATYEFELRLIGSGAPDGEVTVASLVSLAEGLQELTLRIGRDLLADPGPGRTTDVVAAVTEIRLAGLMKGSTRIQFVRGRDGELDLDLPQVAEIDARFWEIIDGVSANVRPPWTTDLVADSTRKLVLALKSAASEVQLSHAAAKPLVLETRALMPEVWEGSTNEPTDRRVPETLVTGRLEAVDLRNRRFRVIDDVGNRIQLDHVQEPESVAYLINHRVRAVGMGTYGIGGLIKGLDAALIEQQSLPTSWTHRVRTDWESELAKPGPTLGGGVDLTDDEFDEFMATIKG